MLTLYGGAVGSQNQRPIELHPLEASEQEIAGYVRKLQRLTAGCSIELDGEQARVCVEHLLYVLQVNSYINLTRITSVDEALTLHIIDSLLFCSYAPEDASRFLDMGTGAGFPGIPFHVVSGCSGVLLDSVSKKVQAVSCIVDRLGLDGLEMVHDRLESYASAERGGFDVVLARALAPLPTLVEYGAPFLSKGGLLIVSKGTPSEDEVASGDEVARLCGLERVETSELSLPEDLGHRTMLVYERVGNSKVQLPRAVGMAKKSPLA